MSTMAESGDPRYLGPDESQLTRLACPDCYGSLAQIDLATVSYYRCHVGHQWSPQSLAAAQAEKSEASLWTALAALEEQAAFGQHLAAGHPGHDTAAEHKRAAERARELAVLLRDHLGRASDDPG